MVFICHSSNDKPFVDSLTIRLMRGRVAVWVDSLEIKVGDSLMTRIQEGLALMDFLVVVLTPDSVASAWCREELNAAMSRQIRERRTVVLPLLLKECEIPMFLQEKKYADFRKDFEKGFSELYDAISSSIELSAGQNTSAEYISDYAWDYGLAEPDEVYPFEHWASSIDSVSYSRDHSFSVLSRASIRANKVLTKRYLACKSAGLEDIGSSIFLGMIGDLLDKDDHHVNIEKGSKVVQNIRLPDSKTGAEFLVSIEMRRLGEPVENVLFHWGSIFSGIFQDVKGRANTTPEENERLLKILMMPY